MSTEDKTTHTTTSNPFSKMGSNSLENDKKVGQQSEKNTHLAHDQFARSFVVPVFLLFISGFTWSVLCPQFSSSEIWVITDFPEFDETRED